MTPEKEKQQYIKIGSISEIDTNKLSISQINQRFIDSDNNRYALRFNKKIRRIEILKISSKQGIEIVIPVGESLPVPSQIPKPEILEKKKEAQYLSPLRPSNPEIEPKQISLPQASAPIEESLLGGDIDLDIMVAANSSFNSSDTQDDVAVPEAPVYRPPSQLIEHFNKLLAIYKERANAIIRNIQSSRIFEITGDPSENKNIVGNLAREFEAQVFEAIDKMVDIHKEMTSYPRPIAYYISKAPLEKREEMKLIESDKEKLDNLHFFEMQRHTDAIVNAMKKLSLQLMNVLNLKTDSQVKQLQYSNQLMYVDAKNASMYFSQDLDKTILEVENWKKQK